MKNWDFRLSEGMSNFGGRAERFFAFFIQALSLDGDVAELGCWKGQTAREMCRFIEAHDLQRIVHLFDSFEGLNPEMMEYDSERQHEGWYQDGVEAVQGRLEGLSKWEIHKGLFSEFIGKFDQRLCFAYIDADLYRSTVDALVLVKDLIVPGGCLAFDDYGADEWWPGVRRAVDELLSPEEWFTLKDDREKMWQCFAWRKG